MYIPGPEWGQNNGLYSRTAKDTTKEMALRALKDKFKPHYFEPQISPCRRAVSEKPRKPGEKKKQCNILQILENIT